MAVPLLELRNLTTHISRDGIVAPVDDVSLTVHEGEAVAIVGESGSGKSMTARSILRLLPSPSGRVVAGQVLFKGRDLLRLSEREMRRLRGAEISMIFQDPMTFLNPIMPIGLQVEEVLKTHRGLRGQALREAGLGALKAARVPSPESIARFYPHQLSGGMRQRVLIAAAMACSPSLLIADEPTTALDVTVQAQILQILKAAVRERHAAMLLITHDLGVVAGICDRVYVMYAGRVVEEAPTLNLFDDPRHPYTRGLLRSVRGMSRRHGEFPGIEGHVPDLSAPPVGCRFHPRCREAMSICSGEAPPLIPREAGGGGGVACWLYARQTVTA